MSFMTLFADATQDTQKKLLGQNIPHFGLSSQASLNNIFTFVYMIAGALAVVFIVIGGIRYILSAGDASRVASAKATIQYAIVGLVIVILAYTITNFVLGTVNVSSWTGLRDSVINTLLYAAGALAVVMIIFGAFRYVTSGGALGDGKSPGNVQKAKATIQNAVVGLVVVILAYTIVNFVIGAF